MLADALEHLVRGVVDNPDDVSVRDKQLRRGSILEVRVHPDDLGKVIGRNGRTATAFRTVVSRPGGSRRSSHRLRRRRPPTLTSPGGPALGQHPLERGVAFGRRPISDFHRRSSSDDEREHVVPSSSADSETIEVVMGRIGKPHGLRGEVTIDVRSDEPERRFAPGAVSGPSRPGQREPPAGAHRGRSRWHPSTLLVTFEELADRNAAEAARGIVLYATSSTADVARGPRRVLRPPAHRAGGVRPRRHAAR